MKENLLKTETFKMGKITLKYYLGSLFFLSLIISVLNGGIWGITNIFMFASIFNSFAKPLMYLASIYMFYNYFAGTFSFLIKRGVKRKEFVIYTAFLILFLTIVTVLTEIVLMSSQNLKVNILEIVEIFIMDLFIFILIASVVEDLTNRRNWKLWLFLIVTAFVLGPKFKEYLTGLRFMLRFIIDIVKNMFSGGFAGSIGIIGGNEAENIFDYSILVCLLIGIFLFDYLAVSLLRKDVKN
ncbi:hypothetical protein [Anaerosphaera multitolerans]|uniref:Uncharacterized protein n=1 Tax=Anaerosphaera multitolerans TaxID=2487351 RepID=A0A437S4U0_9FIRM|nr:hypothetical protein [Anaerosphaera multitolerans]RVU54052.1 hypothetical protein EF514_09285 [Anaerosphaera multitolerans]